MGKFSQYRLQFRDEWKADPLFHKWIEHVDDDRLKAYCKLCRVFLPAHYAGLTDHASCSKHCKNAIHVENGSASAMPQKHRTSSNRSFLCKSSMPRKVLSSECDVERSEGLCTLELTVEDETAQHCNEDVSMNFKNRTGKGNIRELKRRPRNNYKEANGKAFGLLPSDELSPDSKIFKPMQADPVQHRKSKFVSGDLLPQDEKLQDLRKRMKMLQSFDKGVTNFPSATDLILGTNEGSHEDAVCLKQEMAEDIGEVDDDRVTNRLLEFRIDDCDENGLKDIGSLVSATDSTIWRSQEEEPIHTNGFVLKKNKGGRADSMLVKRYPQKYVMRWNSDPALKDWVAPVAGNVYRAKCHWCQVELRAHYKDLKHHAQSTKHTNSAATRDVCSENRNSSGEVSSPDKDFFKSGLSRKFKRSSDAAENKLKQSSCYFLSRSSWGRYKQKYRNAWEIDPNFCGWIAPVEGDVFRARCVYCRVLIRAHHRDLLGIAVGHYRVNNPPTDTEDGLGVDVLKKPIAENSPVSVADSAFLPVVQSLENCVPAAADYGSGGVHSVMFRANGMAGHSEGVTSDPPSFVFSPTDHFMQLQDVTCLTSNAKGSSLLYSNTDTATLLIQVSNTPGECQAPLFNANDDDPRSADKDPRPS